MKGKGAEVVYSGDDNPDENLIDNLIANPGENPGENPNANANANTGEKPVLQFVILLHSPAFNHSITNEEYSPFSREQTTM